MAAVYPAGPDPRIRTEACLVLVMRKGSSISARPTTRAWNRIGWLIYRGSRSNSWFCPPTPWRSDLLATPSNQPQSFQADVAFAADDDVVVNDQAERFR